MGGSLEEDALLSDARIVQGGEITAVTLPQMIQRAQSFYAQHGYPKARADIELRETDDPMRVAMLLRIEPGPQSVVTQRIFVRDGIAYGANLDLDVELMSLQGS